ncbi:T9SS type A sorting domain-containing protein [Mucilaginibacter sp. RS28]|uniref:T9SS type A sorting domain-containing protein n=1 Tax=Mucilaginibacter straminoryzae TaxID=2932774 RepID=A0A9X1X3F8_9SPHI|nr:T9SS type A sorting domain-containing protein [Mucilaginibacter straminoryzae]MCJ8210522.1 T9SS type A sorting domain-containing protein [Mucilaginibacter straminoryzae]
MNNRKFTGAAGFELLFALGVAAIFILPSIVMAQGTRNLDIRISNGDTVINGKNIKELDPQQRRQAQEDINRISAPRGMRVRPGLRPFENREPRDLNNLNDEVRIEKRGDEWVMAEDHGPAPLNGELHVRRIGPGNNQIIIRRKGDVLVDSAVAMDSGVKTDSVRVYSFQETIQPPRPHGDDFFSVPEHREMFSDRLRGGRMGGFARRNSQNFTFENTDGSGITTRISYRVNEVAGQRLKRVAGVEKAELNITDLKLVPDFTSGKTTLMFALPAKGAATVAMTDSEGKPLWEEKAAGASFNKTFALPLNGIYYLKVKQGGKLAIKEIIKED